MSEETSSELTSSNDSGILGSSSTEEVLSLPAKVIKSSPTELEMEIIDGEVFVLQNISSNAISKERHLSSSSKRSSLMEDARTDYFCGLGRCRPKWLQVLVDARFFTFLLCLNCFIEGALVSGKSLYYDFTISHSEHSD